MTTTEDRAGAVLVGREVGVQDETVKTWRIEGRNSYARTCIQTTRHHKRHVLDMALDLRTVRGSLQDESGRLQVPLVCDAANEAPRLALNARQAGF
ncbi:MAG: hypothetical protein EOO38_30850 [Cytophagaceae bacterium]|nr:MAG: hypothetical protein EOO38_30850 [Cytophagaceae bacterium]